MILWCTHEGKGFKRNGFVLKRILRKQARKKWKKKDEGIYLFIFLFSRIWKCLNWTLMWTNGFFMDDGTKDSVKRIFIKIFWHRIWWKSNKHLRGILPRHFNGFYTQKDIDPLNHYFPNKRHQRLPLFVLVILLLTDSSYISPLSDQRTSNAKNCWGCNYELIPAHYLLCVK